MIQQNPAATPGERGAPPPSRGRVAYIMSRFPKLTETFILYEILAVERLGVRVDLYPLLRERADLVHPEAVELTRRARFQPFVSLPILRSNLRCLRRSPAAYLGAIVALLRGTWGSANLLIGAVGIFPKVVHAAGQMAADGVTHVHCHFATHPAAAGFIIHRLTGIPYSFTAHGSDIHVDRHMLAAKVAEADFVVAISQFNAEVIRAECGPVADGKVRIIHSGVDAEVFRPKDDLEGRTAGPLLVTCVGTLHEVKGQRHLIEACRLLRQAGVDVMCTFVGDGRDRPALTEQVRQAGLEGWIRFAGQLTREEVCATIRAADVVAAPSVPTQEGKREGIPTVLIEAMACGVPVVASDLSGIPELVTNGHDGILVPPGDAAALAAAIERLAGDPGLRRRLGANGRATVVSRFDLHTNAATLASRFTGVEK